MYKSHNIKRICPAVAYRYRTESAIEWITPIELVDGGYSFYIQNLDDAHYVWPAGWWCDPLDTEEQAINAGIEYLKVWENGEETLAE